jgi:ferrous iron transport protein B
LFPALPDYAAVHYLINHENFPFANDVQEKIEHIEQKNHFNATRLQAEEIMQRYSRIRQIMQQSVVEEDPLQRKLFTEKLDNLLLHRTWGYVILLSVLFLLFQSIFWLAEYPMTAIEWLFSSASSFLSSALNNGWFSDLLVNGIVAG